MARLRLDFRGHGKSSRDFAEYRYKDLVNDVVEFVTECVGQPTAIFGHSLGGAVGFGAAARLRKQTRGLIVADNFLYHDSFVEITGQPLLRSMLRGVQRIAGLGHTSDEVLPLLIETKLPLGNSEITIGELFAGKSAFLTAWAESISQLDPKAVEIFFTALPPEEFDGDARLKEISCPILLLQASPAMGGILPDQDVERVRSISPQSTVHRLDLGHMMHMENPNQSYRLCSPFWIRS